MSNVMGIMGKSLKAITQDILEGYIAINPIFLKAFDQESLKALYKEIMKAQSEVRGEKFPYNDVQAIRRRNTRLQRLHSAAMIIKNFAREKGVTII